MAVQIKRKEASPKIDDGMTPRQMDALSEVFGSNVSIKHLKAGSVQGISKGDTVVITNDKYPWIKHYQPGDTGVVDFIHPQSETAKTTPAFDPAKHTLYKVKLNSPRDPAFTVLDFPRWAIEPVQGASE